MPRQIEFRMGNADAPNWSWGRDLLDIADDGRVTYQNQRGKVSRTRALRLSFDDTEQLFFALAASPFPRSAEGPFLPGSALIELSVTATPTPDERSPTARLEYHSALKTPGYDRVIALLVALATKLRGAEPVDRARNAWPKR